jgi:hypothetical protein
MGKDKKYNRVISFVARLSMALWLAFFAFDILVFGSVSVYFNLNYLLCLALIANIIDLFYRQC